MDTTTCCAPVAGCCCRSTEDVREKYQNRFQYILVDEYQDTNHAQYTLTKLLSQKWRNICVVGDADQSIYAWRGADVRNIIDFTRDYPDAASIKLEQNYRSTNHFECRQRRHRQQRKPAEEGAVDGKSGRQ